MRDLLKEAEAARIVVDLVRAIDADDEALIATAIEGETNLVEIISKLVADDGADDALLKAISEYEDMLAKRKERIKNRMECRRGAIFSGLDIAGIPKLETPFGTISMRKASPKVVIEDDSAIPSSYWRAQRPMLDKKAVGEMLKSGGTVPGARLDNGAPSVSIRRV